MSSVCPSQTVCPSVTLVDQDHISWKSWKLIARTISPTSSLFVAQRPFTMGTWGNFGENRGRGSGVQEDKSGDISETRKDRWKVTMEGLYELTNALSNGAIPDPLRSPIPQGGALKRAFALRFHFSLCAFHFALLSKTRFISIFVSSYETAV